MANCPKCNATILITQIMIHSKWAPIVCKKCNSKLHFNKKAWRVMIFPSVVLMVLNLLVLNFQRSNFSMQIAILVLFFVFFVKFIMDLNSIKLEIKNN